MTTSAIETLGIAAITIMVFSYAFERRNRLFIAIFALGCALAAAYALFIESYPFLIAESVWCIIALRRWHTSRNLAPPLRS